MKGLFKRGKVWWMRFSYKGEQIKRSTETEDKKLAEKIFCKVTTQIAEGKWFDVDEGKKRTFAELSEKYEKQVFCELKGHKNTKAYLNQLTAFFGSYSLSDITPAVIDDFKQMRKARGVKPATINRQLNVFRRMFNLAKKRWLWIKDVPPIEMEPKADIKRIRYLSFEEYHKLLDGCEDWIREIVIVAAWTGLRQGNVLNLRKDRVDLKARVIMLDSSETKNQENLIIPISGPAFEVLRETIRGGSKNSLYALCDKDEKPYCKKKVERAFKKALKAAGIEDFRFHDLRHCFASWNRQAGVDIDTLADLLGHKDTRMT
ncbi:MAG: putative phage integrase, partial [Deltaproteobacteria bacterium]|nr:putative phage integrase [Deltaproteobacteria bacterium]